MRPHIIPQTPRAPLDRGGARRELVVLLPVFNDWAALGKLLGGLDRALASSGIEADVLVVDDGSTEPFDPSAISGLDFRAIAPGRGPPPPAEPRPPAGHRHRPGVRRGRAPRVPGRRPDGRRRRGRPRGRPPAARPVRAGGPPQDRLRRADQAVRVAASSGPSTRSTGWPTGS